MEKFINEGEKMTANCKAKISKEVFLEELKRRVIRSTEERHFYEGQMKAYEWVLCAMENEVE